MCGCLSQHFQPPNLCLGCCHLYPTLAREEQDWEGPGVLAVGIEAGTWPAWARILTVLSMAFYKWDFGSHLFKRGDNELGEDEKNAKAGRFFRMSWGLRDVKDE